jgi:hypothetical protein
MKNVFEYVIWGISQGSNEESLLLTKFENKPISSKEVAENLLNVLSNKYGCTDLRIQAVNLTDNKIDIFPSA